VPLAYPLALAVTLAVEVPVYAGSLRVARVLTVGRAAALAVLVNLVTHPVLWYGLSRAGPAWFAPAEASAVLVEAFGCWLLLRREPALLLLVSLFANTASVLAGLSASLAGLL
jgi:hypothetical protein